MSFFFEIWVRIASDGPQIDQLHGENRLSHIIIFIIISMLFIRPLLMAVFTLYKDRKSYPIEIKVSIYLEIIFFSTIG